jgi:HlyD family secretion protein
MKYIKNKWFWIFLSIIIIVFIAIFNNNSDENEVEEYAKISNRTISQNLLISGKISSSQEVNIKTELGGIIEEIFVKTGDYVQSRTPIARLKILPDPRSNQDADRQIANAKSQLARIDAAYKRNKELYNQDVISKQEYEASLQEFQVAKNELIAANNFKKIVNQGYANASDFVSNIVYSTTNGVILEIPVKVGGSVINRNTFNEGTTIATIANTDEFIFKGQVNENEMSRIVLGKKLDIKITALKNKKFEAEITKIAPKGIDVGGITKFDIEAKLYLSSDDLAQMRSGYSATAQITLEQVSNVLSIEEKYVQYSSDSAFVWKGNSKDSKKKFVKLGLSDGKFIQILNGLTTKDKVILKDSE